jgi:hypothetical protein
MIWAAETGGCPSWRPSATGRAGSGATSTSTAWRNPVPTREGRASSTSLEHGDWAPLKTMTVPDGEGVTEIHRWRNRQARRPGTEHMKDSCVLIFQAYPAIFAGGGGVQRVPVVQGEKRLGWGACLPILREAPRAPLAR